MDVFSSLLQQLISDLPGARRAIFVDWEGEAVGQAGDDLDAARLMGAHWGVVHSLMKRSLERHDLPPDGVVLSFSDQRVVIKAVTDGYLVVCQTTRDVSPSHELSACALIAEKLQEEM